MELRRVDGSVIGNGEAVKGIAEEHRADLRGADLCEAYLRGANLREAKLRGADLCAANLCEADLCEANLCEANLRGANLRGANLRGANLRAANLYGADLRAANLRGANLYAAYLRGAELCEADLRGANLREAKLRAANLRGANLRGANLYAADTDERTRFPDYSICPEEGVFVGWKQCRDKRIVKLRIPECARRTSSLVGRKCRAEFATTLAIWDRDGNHADEAWSYHERGFFYRVGDVVKADVYDPSPLVECSGGIHFFITRKEAEEYR
jgi:hypothetical protein